MKTLTRQNPQRKIYKKPILTKQAKKYLYIKRIADIVMSLCVLAVTAPLLMFFMILIKLESKGPVFFLQKRVGKDGRVFDIIKLRTMYAENNCNSSPTTRENDPRITKVGKLIRACSIDEFPQFINVLKGDMSYIGPRPISIDEHCLVLKNLSQNKHPMPQGFVPVVLPGITGWALLHGREKISYEDRFKLNAQYENNLSAFFDLKIFAITVKKYLLINLFVMFLFACAVFIIF